MIVVTKEFVQHLRKATNVYLKTDNGKDLVLRLINEKARGNKSVTYGLTNPAFFRRQPAYAFFSSHKQISGWEALGLIIRSGDEVRFYARDNRNGYEKTATAYLGNEKYEGLHHDQLVASVHRNGKKILNSLVLEQSVCPDNGVRPIKGSL